MKSQLIMPCIATFVLAATAPAFAQSADSEDPPAVPTSEPAKGHRLSHINGVPIRVGEHGEYYYDTHKMRPVNIAINPFGLLVGWYGLSVSMAMSERVALRGEFTLLKPPSGSSTGLELDVGLSVYFRRMYSGFFVEPGLMYRTNGSEYDESVEFGPQVLVGWHWSWDSGYNVVVAGGVGRNLSTERDGYPTDIFVNGYFKIGKQF